MARTLIGIVLAAALLYLGLCALLFFFQRSLIYFPQPAAAVGSVPTITLATSQGEVIVTTRPRPGAAAVLYFGGNAEDVRRSLPELAAAFPEQALYLMHYRGYGGSAGSPSEAALLSDALALFDRVAPDHAQVVAVGRSLGSGVAVYLASVRPVARLVLVTPYDSLQEIAAGQFPIFPVRWLLRDRFDAGRHAPRVTAPTLLLAAEHDEIIPGASTQQLYRRFAPGVASLQVLPGTGHNTISAAPGYAALLGGRG